MSSREAKAMFRLAVPVVLGDLGWMTLSLVDTLVVGRLGAAALGAIGIGRTLLIGSAIFGIGLMYGLDTLVSRAHGAGDRTETHRLWIQGVWIALLTTPPSVAVLLGAGALLPSFGVDPEVVAHAQGYVHASAWAILPLFLYTALRRYLQAIDRVRVVMLAMLGANGVNLVFDVALVHGKWGAPQLGAAGAGWATVASIGAVALVLFLAILREERRRPSGLAGVPKGPDRARLGALVRLGTPAAVQILLEIGVFTAATLLVSRMAAVDLAAHQVALTIASYTFLVPQGISVAGAVRVGQALGRGDGDGAVIAGRMALAFGTGFMALSATAFLVAPRFWAGLFTSDAGVLALSASVLRVAGLFQLSDGVQVVATGVLRGAGDTRTPMLWNLLTHWLVGLPLCWGLGVAAGLGVVGVWWGLLAGLTLVAVALVAVWRRRESRLRAGLEPPPLRLGRAV